MTYEPRSWINSTEATAKQQNNVPLKKPWSSRVQCVLYQFPGYKFYTQKSWGPKSGAGRPHVLNKNYTNLCVIVSIILLAVKYYTFMNVMRFKYEETR